MSDGAGPGGGTCCICGGTIMGYDSHFYSDGRMICVYGTKCATAEVIKEKLGLSVEEFRQQWWYWTDG